LSELRDGQSALVSVLEELDGDDDDAVLSRLARVIERLPDGEAYRPSRDDLRGALEQARESVRGLHSYADPEAFDPGALTALDERVSTLQQIARKFGGPCRPPLAMLEELRVKQKSLLDDAERLVTLDAEIAELEGREATLAGAARSDREAAARRLTEAVSEQLPRVALAHATLRFEVAGDDGSEARYSSAEPGSARGPLQALASGGELSRVLLALSLETVHDDVVAVFDEVDAGVGGQVAQQIGDCLHELGLKQQVLAVTHLASVAAKADHHFVIDKSIRAVRRHDINSTGEWRGRVWPRSHECSPVMR
jgi:DNA repair protein RecN (Recombination protein N)